MITDLIPAAIPNWINGEQVDALSGEAFDKLSPHSGKKLFGVCRSLAADVAQAVRAATGAQPGWAGLYIGDMSQARGGYCDGDRYELLRSDG